MCGVWDTVVDRERRKKKVFVVENKVTSKGEAGGRAMTLMTMAVVLTIALYSLCDQADWEVNVKSEVARMLLILAGNVKSNLGPAPHSSASLMLIFF